MKMTILDIATVASLLALNIDILLQNRRVYQRKSSEDISLLGVLVRYVAIFVLLAKYVSIYDSVLITGQALIAINVTVYIWLIWKYRQKLI